MSDPNFVSLAGGAVFFALSVIFLLREKTIIAPAFALSFVWFISFFCIFLYGDALYGVSWASLFIFISAVGVFSLAITIGELVPMDMGSARPMTKSRDRFIIYSFVIVLVLGFPVFFSYLSQFSNSPLLSHEFFEQVRQGMLRQSRELKHLPFVNNLVTLSTIASVISISLSQGFKEHKIAVLVIVVSALCYNGVTASKSHLVSLIVMLFVVYSLEKGVVSFRIVVGAFVFFVSAFVLVSVFRDIGLQGGGERIIYLAIDKMVYYLVSGPIGFSVFIKQSQSVMPSGDPWLFFERTSNYFGNFFDLAAQRASFISLGKGIGGYNTYTGIFTYFCAYGLAGVCFFYGVIGFFCGLVFRLAKKGIFFAQILYAYLFYGIVMSIFGDEFFLALNFIMKLSLACLLVSFFRRMQISRRFSQRRYLQ